MKNQRMRTIKWRVHIAMMGAVCLGAVGTPAAGAWGTCLANEWVKLIGSDNESGDVFGYSSSISGKVVLVGAYSDDDNGNSAGAAYIFRFNGIDWKQEAKLLPADGAANDLFGRDVSLSGNVALIGAPNDDDGGNDSGSAYVYRYDSLTGTWNQEQKLTASDAATFATFGHSVATNGSVALIGALGENHAGLGSGAAYIFEYDSSTGTWNEKAKLVASDAAAFESFGSSVSISGITALGLSTALPAVVVGASQDGNLGVTAGAAYVFEKPNGGWDSVPSPIIEDAKLTASDAAEHDQFGFSVSISQMQVSSGPFTFLREVVMVGAPFDDDAATDSGSAYVFESPVLGWTDTTENFKLTASDAAEGDEFGWDVSISNKAAVISAYDDDVGIHNKVGSAYVFRFNGTNWDEDAKLLASDGQGADEFGYSVSLDGDTAVIGAAQFINGGSGGKAYVFSGLSDCNGNGTIDICETDNGSSPDCNGNGVPDECDITSGASCDCNNNEIPDECEGCIGDLDGDGDVDANDLQELQASWGPCNCCPADLNCDGVVDQTDEDILLDHWGPCP